MLAVHANLPTQGLNEHVSALVAILVSSSSEEIQSLVKIKVKMAQKVATHKRCDLILGLHRWMRAKERRRRRREKERERDDDDDDDDGGSNVKLIN